MIKFNKHNVMEEHIPSQETAIFFAHKIADLENKYKASKGNKK